MRRYGAARCETGARPVRQVNDSAVMTRRKTEPASRSQTTIRSIIASSSIPSSAREQKIRNDFHPGRPLRGVKRFTRASIACGTSVRVAFRKTALETQGAGVAAPPADLPGDRLVGENRANVAP